METNNSAIYEYVYILNYNTASLQVIKLTKEDEELYEDDIECMLVDYGINIDEVSWMISDRELEVEELEKINNDKNRRIDK